MFLSVACFFRSFFFFRHFSSFLVAFSISYFFLFSVLSFLEQSPFPVLPSACRCSHESAVCRCAHELSVCRCAHELSVESVFSWIVCLSMCSWMGCLSMCSWTVCQVGVVMNCLSVESVFSWIDCRVGVLMNCLSVESVFSWIVCLSMYSWIGCLSSRCCHESNLLRVASMGNECMSLLPLGRKW